MRITIISLTLSALALLPFGAPLVPSPQATLASSTFNQNPQPQQTPVRPPASSTTPPVTSNTSPQDVDETNRVTINIVRLPITVIDKKDQPVPGLTAEDFVIFEDKKPQTIQSFNSDFERLPVYVGVLMDTSSSTAGKMKFSQEAAMNFIHTVVRLRKDRVAFVTFDDEIKLHQDFTDKLDMLDRAVYGIKKPGHHTALFDAVWQFCDEKMRGLAGARRALVVITDGDDTYSRATLRDAIDIAQRTETIVFAISTKAGFAGTVPGVEAGQVADRGDRDLESLCEETGGKAFFTGDFIALERSFTKIAKELRSQYLITYRPTNNIYDGRKRKIEVKLAAKRDGLKVRTRDGYTAVNDTVR
ncbi:MAG: VWA domain-containing protein [Acidobacteriota bacterium]|nr:VWA domain-containing protein [Acidobacteriota bacterium]